MNAAAIELTDYSDMGLHRAAERAGMDEHDFADNAIRIAIEDMIDAIEAEEAYAEFLRDPVTYGHEEACRMCGAA